MNSDLLGYKRRDVKRQRTKESSLSSMSDCVTSSSSEDESSKRTALLVHFEGKGPGSIRFWSRFETPKTN